MINPLVPEVHQDKNGKLVTRRVSERKLRKLGLVPVAPPPPVDTKAIESKTMRAALIALFREHNTTDLTVPEWNRVIHKIEHRELKIVLKAFRAYPEDRTTIIQLTNRYCRDEDDLRELFSCLPVLSGKQYDADFMDDLIYSAKRSGLIPKKIAGLKDRAFIDAVLLVSGAMYHDSGPLRDTELAYSIQDESLVERLRERPEDATAIAALAKERGPSLGGSTVRAYLDLPSQIMSEGVL